MTKTKSKCCVASVRWDSMDYFYLICCGCDKEIKKEDVIK